MSLHAIPSGLAGDDLIAAMNDRLRRVAQTAAAVPARTTSTGSVPTTGGGDGTTPTSLTFGDITGNFTAPQLANIAGGINIGQLTGSFNVGQIAQIQAGINIQNLIGTLSAQQIQQIQGGLNIGAIAGSFSVGQITEIAGGLNLGSIAGSFSLGQLGQISGGINIGSFTGVLVTQQVADGLINSLRMISQSFSVPKRVNGLPAINSDYPPGSLVLDTSVSPAKLYQNVAGTWTLVTASSSISGQIQAADVVSVNAGTIIGLIVAAQIQSITTGQLTGQVSAGQIASVNAATIVGLVQATQIQSISATQITGSITSGQITSITASQITGSITASQISSVNASAITGGISASQINSVNASAITGQINAGNVNTISIQTFTGILNVGTQIGDNTITSAKIASLQIGQITGWNGASVNVGSGGFTFQSVFGNIQVGTSSNGIYMPSAGLVASDVTVNGSYYQNIFLNGLVQTLHVVDSGGFFYSAGHQGTGFPTTPSATEFVTTSAGPRPIRGGLICQT